MIDKYTGKQLASPLDTIQPVKIRIHIKDQESPPETAEIVRLLKALQSFNNIVCYTLGREVCRTVRCKIDKMATRAAKPTRGTKDLTVVSEFDRRGLQRIAAALRTLDLKTAHRILSGKTKEKPIA